MLRHEKNERRFEKIVQGELDAVIGDPPFNVSELTDEVAIGGFDDHKPIKRKFGLWDEGYSPFWLIQMAGFVVKPGGWLILKSGDVNFGMVREFGERSPKTLARYLEFFQFMKVIGPYDKETLEAITSPWGYYCTVAWKRTNPPASVRKTMQSTIEYFQVLKRLGPGGKSVKPIALNFLGQRGEMHNWMREGPRCQEPERLYWHKLAGTIIPCLRPSKCNLCAAGDERYSHPAQTPLYVWRWIFERFTKPEMKVYDPYGGLGTTIMANEQSKFGLDIFASEQDEEYVQVHNMWREGAWSIPPIKGVEQVTM